MTKKKRITKTSMYKLAQKFVDYLTENDMMEATTIYVAGVRIFGKDIDKTTKALCTEKTTPKGTTYFEQEADVEKYLDYCNPKTISLSFEGLLYNRINDCRDDFLYTLSETFLDEFGLHFEQGNAWNMSAYEN